MKWVPLAVWISDGCGRRGPSMRSISSQTFSMFQLLLRVQIHQSGLGTQAASGLSDATHIIKQGGFFLSFFLFLAYGVHHRYKPLQQSHSCSTPWKKVFQFCYIDGFKFHTLPSLHVTYYTFNLLALSPTMILGVTILMPFSTLSSTALGVVFLN